MSDARSTDPAVTVSADLQHEIEQLLYYEAELLDSFRLEEWLELLTADVKITAPIRRNTHPGTEQSQFSEEGYYLNNGYDILRERVTRLSKEYAWAENPRSRVRHVLGNVRVVEADTDEYVVSNNQLVYRSYGDRGDNDVLSSQRKTTLRRVDGDLKIDERVVYFDDSVMDLKNLTIVLL
jgi:3-phenylpropionate/cinnamic acid dioxygenase small subunit